jgi:Flp pilus assembly protein CpaB
MALTSTVKPVQVVVAAQDLNAGTQLTADNLEVRTVPRGGLPEGTFSNVADLIGKTLTVARVSGDPITAYVVGDTGSDAGIPAMLEPNTVAIAVRVDQATGLAGVLRPGQHVTIIAIIDPASIPQGQASQFYAPSVDLGFGATPDTSGLNLPNATPAPTATPLQPVSPAARITITGLKVLVVPQSFRYEEVTNNGSSDSFAPAYTSAQAQNNNVVLLQASIVPIEIAPGVIASPAEVLALLNDTAKIHLALEPSGGITIDVNAEGIDLAKLYEAITGIELQP